MAIALEYQTVYCPTHVRTQSLRWHVVAAVFLMLALASKIWVKLEITDLSYALSAEKTRAMGLDMERRELELQRSVLLREDRLARLAQERLQLTLPARGQVMKLRIE
ncbi:MAG: hypothetical protein QY326_07855 [Bdellovibrionota bacterium]|nr:MAG: hypothetical protein QY326_07855 [Bdellovibrionota bacterium]